MSGSVRHLDLLATVSRFFGRSLNFLETTEFALRTIADHLQADGASVFLLEDGGGKLVCRACTGSVDIAGAELKSDDGIVGQCVGDQRARLVANAAADPHFCDQIDRLTGSQTRSLLCAPLTAGDLKLGAIEVISMGGDGKLFSLDDLTMLQTLAAEMALAITNAHMSIELLERERMRHELVLAAEIQRGLFPRNDSEHPAIHGFNLPAYAVSGDFYDYFIRSDGRLCFCLGDVAGKGIYAALLVSKAASLFRCLGKTAKDPKQLLQRINEELCETATAGTYVTMIAGFFDYRTGIAVLANAGHPPPLLVGRGGQIQAIEDSGLPAGIFSGAQFSDTLTLTPVVLAGGTLYLYTDGVTESKLETGARLSETGLAEMLSEVPGLLELPARVTMLAERITSLATAVQDDITLLAIEDQAPNLAAYAAEYSDDQRR